MTLDKSCTKIKDEASDAKTNLSNASESLHKDSDENNPPKSPSILFKPFRRTYRANLAKKFVRSPKAEKPPEKKILDKFNV